MQPVSDASTTSQINVFDSLQHSGSVRFLRGSVIWGIKVAVVILAVFAFPVVLICFFIGCLIFMPLLAFLQGCRFIWSLFGFKFQFPKLWSNPFPKFWSNPFKKKTDATPPAE